MLVSRGDRLRRDGLSLSTKLLPAVPDTAGQSAVDAKGGSDYRGAVALLAIRMDPRDNVAVVTAEVKPGQVVQLSDGCKVQPTEIIPRGGKVALTAIPAGSAVVRYGEEIGLATEDIASGQHVHTHNLGGPQ